MDSHLEQRNISDILAEYEEKWNAMSPDGIVNLKNYIKEMDSNESG